MHMTTAMFKRSAATVGLMPLLWILSTLILPSSSHAAIFFDTDWETCAVAPAVTFPCEGWVSNHHGAGTPPNISGGIAIIENTGAAYTQANFTGSNGLRGIHDSKGYAGQNPSENGGNTVRPTVAHAFPAGTKHLFVRWAFREAPGFEYCAINGNTKLIRFLGQEYPKIWINNIRGNYSISVEGPYQSDSFQTFTGKSVSTSAWQQLQFEWQINTPGQYNGVMRLWVDGVLIINLVNRAWIGPTSTSKCNLGNGQNTCPSTFSISSMEIYLQCGLGTMYYDRIAAGDTSIPPVGSFPIGDTTAPTTPAITGLSTSGTTNSLTITPSTDSGSGMASHSLLFCTGAACTPSTGISLSATVTAYAHTGLTANTLYRYSLRGNDAAGNPSALSPIMEITTPVAASSYYTLVFTDNFNRADAVTLGASWQSGYSTDTAEAIVSNQLRPISLNTDATQTYSTAVANDIAASVTLAQGNGSGVRAPGILTRYSDPATKNGYECRILLPATARIGEWNTNVFTQKTSVAVSPAWAAADTLWCETIGTTTSMYRERAGVKTLLTSFSDATHASGKIGIIHYQQSGTLGDVQIDNFSVYSVSSTPSVPPTITSIVLNAGNTAVTHLYGPTTPTQIRVRYGNNTQGTLYNTVRPLADFPGGVLSITLPNGTTYYGAFPLDAAGVENSSGGYFINTSSIVPELDIDPVVMSNPFPTTNRPAGTTSADYGVEVDKAVSCRSHTSDVSYAEMLTDLTTSGIVASGTQAGLTNGSTTTLYIRCNFINEALDEYPNLTSQVVTIVVDASTVDVTPPGAPTDPVASPDINTSDITLTWGASSGGDVARYHVFKAVYDTGVCGTYSLAGNTVVTTLSVFPNAPLATYCFKVQAEDTSGNLSAFSVESAPVTTGEEPDIEPPSDAGILSVQSYTQSVVFTWPAATDNKGKPNSTVEICQGVACTDFMTASGTVITDERFEVNLSPNTAYRARVIHCDAVGLCGAYSPIIAFMTTTTGLNAPRQPVPFGTIRGDAARDPSGARLPRP